MASNGRLSEYHGTTPTGGNSLTQDLNIFYSSGDLAWLITATSLIFLMIPGIGLFYSGLCRRKSALSLIWLSIMSSAVVTFQWFFWGYSLVFSHTSGSFLGNLANFGLRNVLAAPSVASERIPDLLFCVFQGMFACVTAALAVGAVSERGKMLPCVVFIFIWTTLVYDPIARWSWNPAGWSYRLGGLDFAGGTPVHITSGSTALAYSYILGKRTGHGTHALNYRPHNVTYIVIGTVFLWLGWFGFNAGSALSANLRAVMAILVTNLAACCGGITWCLLDYRLEKKWSTVGSCSGVVAGLVCVTPGSGYIPPWAAVIYGVVAGVVCNYATQLKYWIDADDALDVFAVHGIGGILGNLLTGLFAADYIAHLDGYTVIKGGWVNGHWVQLAIQLADSITGMAYSFFVTCAILLSISFLSRWIPALKLRVSPDEEAVGIDDAELGEFAYDYVELLRDVKPEGMRDHEHFDSSHDMRSVRRISGASQSPFMDEAMPNDYPLRDFSRETEPSSSVGRAA